MRQRNNHRVIILCFIGILVISINPVWVSAAEYFVATTGHDSNSGTINNPFRTLEKAASVMSSGDTMFIRAGKYQRTAWDLNVPSGGGTWSTATKVKAYNNEQVILTPQDPTAATGTDVIQLPAGKSYIIFDGLILDGLRNGSSNGGRMGFRFVRFSAGPTNRSHHIRISNSELRNTYNSLLYTADATDNQFLNLRIHGSAVSYGIYMSSGNNLVQDCTIYENKWSGNSNKGGYGVHNYSAHADFKPNNNTYIGNIFHSNDLSGIIVAAGTGVKLINNIFYNNGQSTYTGTQRYGIRIDLGGTNVLVYNNTSYNNGNGELLIGPEGSNVTAKNNIWFGTNPGDYTVYIHSGSIGNTVTNNTIYHANSSLRLFNQGSGTISNNINTNPLFVDANRTDFRLQAGSSAIGKGVFLNEVKVDFDKIQRQDPYDIGAYAFVSSSLPESTPPAPPKEVRVH